MFPIASHSWQGATRADSGFFLGGAAPCLTSTPINQFFCGIPVILESHMSSKEGCTPPAPSPLSLGVPLSKALHGRNSLIK